MIVPDSFVVICCSSTASSASYIDFALAALSHTYACTHTTKTHNIKEQMRSAAIFFIHQH